MCRFRWIMVTNIMMNFRNKIKLTFGNRRLIFILEIVSFLFKTPLIKSYEI